MLRTLVDQEARKFGMTRAQWGVLFRLERSEGLKQSELADLLDIQPITLTRLIDRLCENGLIERRSDPNDRRAKRLFLTPAARPLLDRLNTLTTEMLTSTLQGLERPAVERMTGHLAAIKENLREQIGLRAQAAGSEKEPRYG
ncbi:MAG TPA: MarR family transcriptional regulator [Xanthobacteraceae bacterium]|nr:MarR family transcriptional regulator [Xanthobacteraceae bacterium]